MKTKLCLAVLLFVFAGARGDDAANPVGAPTALIQHVVEHRDGQAPHSIDFAALNGDRSSLPIGVFDSGIGGLTVLEAILKLDAFNNVTLQPRADGVPDFAGEKFIYFGDQANMPYGNYPAKGKEDFLRELIVNDAVFLLGKRYHGEKGTKFDKPAVKAIVIACNTATAYGIEDIRAALQTWGLDVPVIGVVEAGARAVVEQLPKDGKAPTVGVLATVGTCSSNAYPKAIARMAGLAGKPAPEVVQQGSLGLAGAIEGNPAYVWQGAGERPVPYAGPKTASPATLNSVADYAAFDSDELVTTLNRLRSASPGSLDMVILGCTHFPLVQKEIGEALDRNAQSGFLGKTKRIFINPAEYTAKDLFRELARAKLRNKSDVTKLTVPSAEFFLSVANPKAGGVKLAADGSLDTPYKEGREPGHANREDTEVIRMTPETLPASSSSLIAMLPTVWQQLQKIPKVSEHAK
jgi:glutamate racemase